jgi:hypothetical protein
MICPECKAQEVRSVVFVGGSVTTLMNCPSFFDENGLYHEHNTNLRRHSYLCSRGHRWTELDDNKCPNCDWSLSNRSTTTTPHPSKGDPS